MWRSLILLLGAIGCADSSPGLSPVTSGTDLPAPAAASSAAPISSAAPTSSAARTSSAAGSATATIPARGQCTNRQTLKTAEGDVSCYPFRCRDGACLTQCDKREDCAGSDGPGDLAENGWPLDCRWTTHTCVPLPPQHVRRR